MISSTLAKAYVIASVILATGTGSLTEPWQAQAQQPDATEQLRAAILKGRRALVASCVESVNSRSVGKNFEAYVTTDEKMAIKYLGTSQDKFRFEKCLAERESNSGTLLPKEKWGK